MIDNAATQRFIFRSPLDMLGSLFYLRGMTGNQKAQLSEAEALHAVLQVEFPLYKETGHWIPVICNVNNFGRVDILDWLDNRGLVRGDRENRNDYLIPYRSLWLFKDRKIAMEFKLLWT